MFAKQQLFGASVTKTSCVSGKGAVKLNADVGAENKPEQFLLLKLLQGRLKLKKKKN